jgi:peptidoglycan-N-acetylglucosamine deacetylase
VGSVAGSEREVTLVRDRLDNLGDKSPDRPKDHSSEAVERPGADERLIPGANERQSRGSEEVSIREASSPRIEEETVLIGEAAGVEEETVLIREAAVPPGGSDETVELGGEESAPEGDETVAMRATETPGDETVAMRAGETASGDETVAMRAGETVGGEETVAITAAETAVSRGDKRVAIRRGVGLARGGEPTVELGDATQPGPDGDQTVGGDRTVAMRATEVPGPEGDEAVSIWSVQAPPSRGDETVSLPRDGDETTALAAGGDETTAFRAGGDETTALRAGGDETAALAAGSEANAAAAVPAQGGPVDGGGDETTEWLKGAGERLRELGAKGRAQVLDSKGAQLAAEQLEKLRETKGGQAAAEQVAKLQQYGDAHPVARRRLLIAVPSAAGLAILGGVIAEATKPDKPAKPASTAAHNARATTKPRTAPALEHTTTSPMPVQKKPIFTLSDYRRITGAPAFPSDAIALTIDDGPHPVWTPKILHLLDKYHVPAMFCMIGNQVLGHEAVATTVTKAGHQLANHTWSHPTKLDGRPRDQVRKEIERAQAKIQKTTGYAPKLFRSPGGVWSPMVLEETARAGLVPLDWSDDPRDWSMPGVAHIKSTLMAAKPGQILLCHDGGGDRSQTYQALSAVIPALTAKGLRFVAL